MKRWTLFVVMTACLLFGVMGVSHAATKPVKADAAGSVSISLSTVSATAGYYEFSDNGVRIRFFAVLGTDERPRVAFDACDVCGGRLGYQQNGTDITCRKCGRVFTIDGIGTRNTGYGCWPSYLPFTVKGGKIIIKTDDLKKGRGRFLEG